MRTQHTPGPWSAYISKKAKVVCVSIGEKPNGRNPSIVNWPGFESCDLPLDQQIANARLIAAAPDMYAALEQIAQVNEYNTSSMGWVVELAKTVLKKVNP